MYGDCMHSPCALSLFNTVSGVCARVCIQERITGYINFFVASSFAWRALVVSVVRVCGAVSNGFRTHSVWVRCSYRTDRFIFLVFCRFYIIIQTKRKKKWIYVLWLFLIVALIDNSIYSFDMKICGHIKNGEHNWNLFKSFKSIGQFSGVFQQNRSHNFFSVRHQFDFAVLLNYRIRILLPLRQKWRVLQFDQFENWVNENRFLPQVEKK